MGPFLRSIRRMSARGNLRAVALTKLGRKQEAATTISEVLRRDPENAITHANMGSKLLHEGRAKEAGNSFREALRLEPGNEWRGRGPDSSAAPRPATPFTGSSCGTPFFMGRLNPQVQFGLMVGMFFLSLPRAGGHKVQSHSRAMAAGCSSRTPLVVVSTWLADPLFNLLLRVHPLGRHAVNGREKWQGTVLGFYILLTFACLGLWLSMRAEDLLFAAAALIFAGMPMTSAIILPTVWAASSCGALAAWRRRLPRWQVCWACGRGAAHSVHGVPGCDHLRGCIDVGVGGDEPVSNT